MAGTAALILAAGQASRFGGGKLTAALDGRPLLQHVLDLAFELSLAPVVVVLGPDAGAVRLVCAWRNELVVVNDRPADGISRSVQLGLAALEEATAERALVLLGDQPRLAAAQALAVLAVSPDPARPIVVPRFGGKPGNPVLLERAVWPLARELTGDSGMVQIARSRPNLVRYVDIAGTNPDVDTRSDLRALESPR